MKEKSNRDNKRKKQYSIIMYKFLIISLNFYLLFNYNKKKLYKFNTKQDLSKPKIKLNINL